MYIIETKKQNKTIICTGGVMSIMCFPITTKKPRGVMSIHCKMRGY